MAKDLRMRWGFDTKTQGAIVNAQTRVCGDCEPGPPVKKHVAGHPGTHWDYSVQYNVILQFYSSRASYLGEGTLEALSKAPLMLRLEEVEFFLV